MKYAGETSFTEQPSGRRFRPETGWSRVRVWRGAKTGLEAFLSQFIPSGYLTLETEEDVEYAVVKCEYSFEPGKPDPSPPADPLVRTWESVPNRIEKTVWELPFVIAGLAKLTPKEIASTRQFIEAALDQFQDPNTFTIGVNDELKPLYILLLKKVEAFRATQPVLRKTETVIATSSALTAQHSNSGRYFTYAQLTQHEPTLDAAKLIDAPGLGPTGRNVLWYKFDPEVRELGRGQWQIVQEYEGDAAFEPIIYKQAE